MKGIVTCQDCPINITIYRFTGNQGFFSVPKKWCEECDLLVRLVEKTVKELGIESKTKITIKPWFLWWWQSLFLYFAWHAPILIINGKLVNQGIIPSKQNLIKALTSHEIVVRGTELDKVSSYTAEQKGKV